MNTSELLELAAKAAGIAIDKSPHNGGGHGNTGFDILGNVILDWHNNKTWNPLYDDGDCARLEETLLLEVKWDSYGVSVGESNLWPEIEKYTAHDGNKQAARRMATVRAAAAIGRDMK